MKEKLNNLHHETFSTNPSHTYFVPGRINLMGEQAEEMGCDTLSIAIDRGYYLGLSFGKEKRLQLNCEGCFAFTHEFELNKSKDYNPEKALENNVQGVLNKLLKEGHTFDQGLDISIVTDFPGPHGFAQTPAFTYAVMFALNDACDLGISNNKLVRFTDTVFKEYLGSMTRLHDLMTIAYSKANHATYIQGKTKDVELIPYSFKANQLYAFFPDKVHDDKLEKYKRRLRSAKNATMHFDDIRPIRTLCEFPYDLFNRFKSQLHDEEERSVAEHIIFEHDRVKNAKDALQDNDLDWFIEYMNQSQKSLNLLFDLSTNDLNLIVDHTMVNEALCSRISNRTTYKLVVTLFKEPQQETQLRDLVKEYEKLYKKKLHILDIQSADGAHKY